MNNKVLLLLVLTASVLLSPACSQANSIWAKRDKNMKAVYADDVARQIGDVLTITITENSKVDNKAKRDMKKETDRSTAFDGKLGNFADLGEFGMDAQSNNELKSKADYKDERKFVDNITVVVVDILPNRNLVVLGSRNRDISGDTQTISYCLQKRRSFSAVHQTGLARQHIRYSLAVLTEPYRQIYFSQSDNL
ncbi:MAG: flagellar basal body L-ring protein FlgH [Planctomycetota bacterium]|jgi:flagellar basal body L-ring protein FlgH